MELIQTIIKTCKKIKNFDIKSLKKKNEDELISLFKDVIK